MKTLLSLGLLASSLFTTYASAEGCAGCVAPNETVRQELRTLAAQAPKAILSLVRKQGTCVKILASGRKLPAGLFHWGAVEKPIGNLSEVTKIKGLMGKTLCPGEHPLAENCTTIVLAHDAPRSTLLHELLHVRQLQGDAAWCPLSKKLWKEAPSAEYQRALHDKEWDVHQLLWEERERLHLALEDKLTIADETLTEATARKDYDASAAAYVKEQKIAEALQGYVSEYTKALSKK